MALNTTARPSVVGAAPRQRAGRTVVRRRLAKTGVLLGLVIGAVFAAGPVLWMLSSSFKSYTQSF